MKDQDLDRMEQDLDAVAAGLASRLDWEQLEPRVRWALGRPMRELLGTVCLIVVGLGIGYWTPVGWMVAVGLLLVVLPGRVKEVRERRRVLDGVGEGDLLALIRRELMVGLAHQFTQALVAVGFALLYMLVGVLVADSRPGLLAAAVLAVIAVVRFFWLLPRASRALREFERGEIAA